MANTTKSKTENESYWGYILFSAIALICTLNSGNIYQFLVDDNGSNRNKTHQTTTIHNKSKPKKKIHTCSICGRETGKHADQMWKGKCYMCYTATKKKRNH